MELKHGDDIYDSLRYVSEQTARRIPGKAVVTLKGMGTLSYDAFGNLVMEIRADQASSDLLRAAGIDIRDDGIVSIERPDVSGHAEPDADVRDRRPAGRGQGPARDEPSPPLAG